MNRTKLLIIIVSLLTFGQYTFCANVKFRLLDTRNGLFNNQVQFITQMEDGKILVYTEGMFNVYNGNTFEPLTCDLTYTIPLGMHNSCTVYDNGNGLLWAKDYHRLYLIDGRTQRFCNNIKQLFEASEVKESLNDFILDQDKKAWLITESGKLYRYDWKSPAMLVYQPSKEELKKGIRVKEVIQSGPFHFIFLNTGKMLCWEEKNLSIIHEDNTITTSEPSEHFRTTWIQKDHQTLIISNIHPHHELYTYNIYTRQWNTVLSDVSFYDIKKTNDGDFLLGGRNSLIRLSNDLRIIKETNHLEAIEKKDINDVIISILIDKQNGLWLGTGSNGILKNIPKNTFLSYYPNTLGINYESRYIRTICQYDDENLLVGTLCGLYMFNTRNKTYQTALPDFEPVYYTNIKKSDDGHFWISSRKGLYCFRDGKITRKDKELISEEVSEIIRFCLPLKDGRILVCVDLKDIYLCNPEEHTYILLNKIHPALNKSRAMSFAIETEPGKLILGGQSCLYEFYANGSRLAEIDWINPFEKYSIKFNCAFSEGNGVWVGSQNGLIYHDYGKNETIRLSTEDGLPNNCIQGIVKDSDGDLWVSTSNGIGKIHKNKSEGYSIAKLGLADGIQYGEMMEQSIETMPDGHIYIGGIDGITDINPQITDYNNAVLTPTLVGLQVMDQAINNEGLFNGRCIIPDGLSYTNKIVLEHNENFFDMRFSALNYETPQHTRYRYQLKGVDKDWNYSAENTGICTVSYTSLSPDNYVLQVQSAMGDGAWNEIKEWEIIVKPPFWKTWWAYLLYAIIIITCTYYIVELYIVYKRSRMVAEQDKIKRQKEQALDELKFRFFTNISHEFRTPLALIITPLELLIKNNKDSAIRKDLERILNNAKDLLKLVNQLLDFRRLEQQGEKFKPSAIPIKAFIENSANYFKELAQERNLNLVCECSFTEEDTFILDADKMTRVMNNLISNALKFTPQSGMITVQAGWTYDEVHRDKPNGIRICVSDTGIGIAAEELKNIFVRFYQSKNVHLNGLNTGSGIGLHLTKGYIELHHGEISVESTLGKGSKFIITLPMIAESTLETEEVQLPTETAEPQNQEITDAPSSEEKNISILVVEDNEQFRNFIKTLLENEYHIYVASDGEEGLTAARHYNPDLIISDVMMPKMNGHELCKAIKSDMKCSHIPFILLTAKDSAESRSNAYEVGADSFISKPFDIDVLSSRIHQLLEQRNKRQDLFKKDIAITPKEITITQLDEQLIQKAMECIEKNMNNTEYNVEALSADMGIERSSLYRKMQAIVGLTPSEFMRTVRLKRAAQLLEQSQYSVQEISWMVGFNTPRYFSSYFKEMFGVTPSQYASDKHKKSK